MPRQQPKTSFGKREGNESVSEHIRNHLLTFGLDKMAKPVQDLERWLIERPSERVTIVCPERLPARRVASLLTKVGVKSKVINSKKKLSDETACVLTIPPLCDRLEDIPLTTEVVITEYLKAYNVEFAGMHPSHIPVLYFLCYLYKSGAGLHTPILNEDTYAGFLRKALGEYLFDKTANELVKYSFQDEEREETKDALRPFILLEDKRIEFYLNDLPNASQYGIEDRRIAASLIEPDDPDPISRIRPPHPGRARSVASTEYRLFAEANLSKKDCDGRKLIGIDNLQQRMIKIGAKYGTHLSKLKVTPISDIGRRQVEALEILPRLVDSSSAIHMSADKKFRIFEDDQSVRYLGSKYCLPTRYFLAVKHIAEQKKRSNLTLHKRSVYEYCYGDYFNKVPEYVRAKSVRKWFYDNGGVAKRFVQGGLLKSVSRTECEIPISSDLIEIVPVKDLD